MLFEQKLSYLPTKDLKIRRSGNDLNCPDKLLASGGKDFILKDWQDYKTALAEVDPTFFPSDVVVEIKAIACELPARRNLPFSRFSCNDIANEAINQGIVASISKTTVWRWLSTDAIKPWSYRSWIFPRDPQFKEKAGRVLDLYHGIWEGVPIGEDDYVLSADEKTSIQARHRKASGKPPCPGYQRRFEFEYARHGALAYLAAWDVHRAKLYGCCENKTGIKSYQKLVDLVMQQEPYKSAPRVFWITDNGSSHQGQKSVERLANWYPNAIQIHTPVHASWLNQIEIYFSIVQRKVLAPNEFKDLKELEERIMHFQGYYESIASPFKWEFSKEDLKRLSSKSSWNNKKKEAA
jgi:hypothetical protein